MSQTVWMVLVVIVLIALLIGFALLPDKKGARKPDYFTFFMMGLVWVMIGLFAENNPLWIMGVVFTIVGLSHKNEWDDNRKRLRKMSKGERNARMLIFGVLGLLVAMGLSTLFFARIFI